MKLGCFFIQVLQHSHPNHRCDVNGLLIPPEFQFRPVDRIALKSISQKGQRDERDMSTCHDEVSSTSNVLSNRFFASLFGIIPAVFASTEAWAHVGVAGAIMSATNTQDALHTIQGRPGDIIPEDHYSTTIMLSQSLLHGGHDFIIGQNQLYYSTIMTHSLHPSESIHRNVLSQHPTNILLADESLVGNLLDKAIQALDESEQQSSNKPKPKLKPKLKSRQEQFQEEIEARLDADTAAKQLLQQRQDLIEAETRAAAREIKQLLERNQVEVVEMQKLREQQQIMIEEARKNAKEMEKYQIQERKRLDDFEIKLYAEEQEKTSLQETKLREEQEKLKVEQERLNAELAKVKAEREKTQAEESVLKTEREKILVEAAKLKAEKEKTVAEEAKLKAEREKFAAEEAKLKAEQVRVREQKAAEEAKLNSEREKIVAEEAKLKAEKEQLKSEQEKRLAAEAKEAEKKIARATVTTAEEVKVIANDNKLREEQEKKPRDEQEKKAAEEARVKAEQEKKLKDEQEAKAAEEAKVRAEQKKLKDEQKKKATEEARVKAEQERKLKEAQVYQIPEKKTVVVVTEDKTAYNNNQQSLGSFELKSITRTSSELKPRLKIDSINIPDEFKLPVAGTVIAVGVAAVAIGSAGLDDEESGWNDGTSSTRFQNQEYNGQPKKSFQRTSELEIRNGMKSSSLNKSSEFRNKSAGACFGSGSGIQNPANGQGGGFGGAMKGADRFGGIKSSPMKKSAGFGGSMNGGDAD